MRAEIMKTRMLACLILGVVMVSPLFSSETAVIIKVTGLYGIINKGTNQGLQEGQVFYVKRAVSSQWQDVAKVKVIRTTANRAAVEQITHSRKFVIQKGDKLFANKEVVFTPPVVPKKAAAPPTPVVNKRLGKRPAVEPITEPVNKQNDVSLPEPAYTYQRKSYLREPWVSLNLGSIFPSGELGNAISPSIKFGASYMVSTGNNLNLGIEINRTFFSGSELGNSNLTGSSIESSSILEAIVVFQKYFGNHFFIETGGGIYRPKIKTISVDKIESSFSSSNFGLFGGTGFFIPTSKYAGFTLKGRMHNYFDETTKQYFGLSGGFRFKM